VRRALISDIHGNLEALEAVLTDIAGQRINEIFCIGDLVGYGPNPCECIDLVMANCRVTLLGNHDQAIVSDLTRSKSPAGLADPRTWTQLNDPRDRGRNDVRKAFLSHLPRTYEIGPYQFVHGSPRNPLAEYVFPEDVYNPRKMERLFLLVGHYCFQGHTHIPGIITGSFEYLAPADINGEYCLGEEKLMINVGSVGQPRDGDPRACYVILSEEPADGIDDSTDEDGMPVRSPEITYRRVPYDFETTIRKINDSGLS
jgi:diadenosine tetraphosphatase ApaH/serine/threonine PP2A family protein phosphatase